MTAVKVISTAIESGVRFIKYLRFGRSDVQESREAMPWGIDSNPIENAVAIYAPTGEKGKAVIIGYINRQQLADVGENRIYSTDSSGEESFYLHFKNDGTAEFGGDADFLARFNELKAGFDELKSDFNSLVTAYNSHIHITTATVGATPTPGVISPTTSTGSTSTASIDAAKINEIKTL
jgi:hypothetical protein